MFKLIMLFTLVYFAPLILKFVKFNKSDYKIISGNGFISTIIDKGNYGEYLIFAELEKIIGYKKIYVNTYIPKIDNTTSEIDLIMVTQYGIYVFESKNYSGWIFGDESQKNWTQSFNKNSKFQFYNPIWQNKGHITALDNYLNLNIPDLYKSYIVFGENSTLKDISIKSPDIKVIKVNELIENLKDDLEFYNQKVLNKKELNEINGKLYKCILADDKTKENHIINVGKIVNKEQETIKQVNNAKVCPMCNSNLVLRVAKSGKNKGNSFYGCSNYPNCKHIKNIN